MGTDLLPTILDLLGLPTPSDRVLDGVSLFGMLTGAAPPAERYLYYYEGTTLFAVRDQRFKYRAPNGVFFGTDEMPFGVSIKQKEWLFDLERDPREAYDASDRYPEKVTELRRVFQQRQEKDASNQRGWL